MSETGPQKLTTNFLQTLRYIWTSAKCPYDAAGYKRERLTKQTQPTGLKSIYTFFPTDKATSTT